MGLFTGCLLASDIDDTLMQNGEISGRNVEKIEYFLREGGRFSLATGRSIGAVIPILEKVGHLSASVLTNGSMIYDFENQDILYQAFLNKEDIDITRKVLDMGLEVGIEVHSGFDVLTLARTCETDDHQAYESLPTCLIEFEEAAKRPWNKVLYMFQRESDRFAVKTMIQQEKPGCKFCDTSVMIDRRRRVYYEQFPQGISKATTLRKLCSLLSVEKGKFFAIGDFDNDLEMLQLADISAAPLNACEKVKQIVNFVAGPCKDGAVADFIDYLSRKE